MGHQESLIFLKMLWASRVGLYDKMNTDGNEIGFWNQFKGVKFTSPAWVSDSHAYAYSLLRGVNRVVIVDAHHDCWESDSLGVDKREKQVYCHNWLRAWLNGGKTRKALWIKPEWQDACELPKDMEKKVEVVVYSKGVDLGLEGSVTPHICRSGCWVPPWLDNAFRGFVAGFAGLQKGVVPMQDGDWNPLMNRWTEEDLKQALEAEKQMREMQARFMKTGTVRSSEFLNCKVEQVVTK